MMKKLFLLAVMFCVCIRLSAEIITGIVCDKNTKQPVYSVSVYFDGTSIHTFTDTLGRFKLETKSVINAKLVLQRISYMTSVIDRPFEGLPDTLFIEEKPFILNDVIITAPADPFTREQKMKAFREQFLGMTNAGKSCSILNEDDIYLTFNTKTKKLSVSTDVPVIVINQYLGYKVSFTLMDFWAEYKSVSLNKNNLKKTFFSVTSLFYDLNPNDSRIKQHRDNVYKNSSNWFFINFVNNSLIEKGFELYNKGYSFIPEQFFVIMDDTLSQKKIFIRPDTDINKEGMFKEEKPSAIIDVYYRISSKSKIYFLTDLFSVDTFGNIDCIDKILFTGQMGNSRAGDLLPADYGD